MFKNLNHKKDPMKSYNSEITIGLTSNLNVKLKSNFFIKKNI